MSRVYLDHHAATPLCEAARRAMNDAEAHGWANPASVHGAGRQARRVLEGAREQVAAAIGAEPADLVWTSGGTEACNLGVLGPPGRAGETLVASAIEHPAVMQALERRAAERGGAVQWLSAPRGEPPSLAALDAALDWAPALVAMQWVNHETGNVLPVADYADACRRRGVPLLVDACQGLGKLALDVEALGADLVALGAHKCGGPAGIGALWVRRGCALEPLLRGGSQERGRRAGTPPVVLAAGFGATCAALPARLAAMREVARLRDRLEAGLRHQGGMVNGGAAPRVSTATNASFEGRRGDRLVAALDLEGVCTSSGAACSSGLDEPSPVLRAMYPDQAWRAEAALRFTFGPENTETEVDFTLEALARVLARGAGSES